MNSVRMQLLLVGTMAIWGLNISAIKVLTAHFDPLIISCFRMTLAAVIINFTLIGSRQPIPLLRISASQWLRFALCAGFMIYGNQIFFTTGMRSEEHTSELQSLMRISYAVFCLKKKKNKNTPN